jgi:uncharacterized lipoprotein YajG
MRTLFGIALGFFALAFSGCAFTPANLNVNYDSAAARVGPLSTVKSMTLDIQEFGDKRPDKYRIGYKRNGYGMQTADITTVKPVSQVVKEALVAEFSKNGHLIGPADSQLIISGDITSFWFDYQIGFWTIQFMGTVGIDLKVTDKATGDVLYSRSYQGHYNEESLGGLEGTWQRVMNTALEQMVRDVSTDSKLIDLLKTRT